MHDPILRPYSNPAARTWRTSPGPDVREFHRTFSGYAPTRLVELPDLASDLGVAGVYVKEESARFGLPAFKMLGASYAIARTLGRRFDVPGAPGIEELTSLITESGPVTMVAATDGNHGRAVARTSRMLGLPARIFVPYGISAAAREAIAAEKAELVELDRNYDDTVIAAATDAARTGALLIQDTSREGYRDIPAWIVDGYATLLAEADSQLREAGTTVDVVLVPVGVGSLATAVVRHYRSRDADPPSVVSVEPTAAPAILTSLHAGEARTVPTGETIMAGLNCGTPTRDGWPVLRAGLDRAVAISDDAAASAVRDLEARGVDAGPCGAASLAGVRQLAAAGALCPHTRVLLLSTEGRAANPLP